MTIVLAYSFFTRQVNRLLQEVMYIQIPPSPLTGWGFDIFLHIVKYICTSKQFWLILGDDGSGGCWCWWRYTIGKRRCCARTFLSENDSGWLYIHSVYWVRQSWLVWCAHDAGWECCYGVKMMCDVWWYMMVLTKVILDEDYTQWVKFTLDDEDIGWKWCFMRLLLMKAMLGEYGTA